MRIVIIWGESLAKPGGGTTHCTGLSRGLLSAGHVLTVITPQYGKSRLYTDDLPVRAVRLMSAKLPGFLLFQIMTVFLLPWWILRHRPDVIYVRTCFLQGMMAIVSRALGVPLVGEVDSVVDEEIAMRGQPRWAGTVIRLLDKFNNRLSSGLVCVTRGLAEESIRRGGKPQTTVAIHNGAQSQLMQPGDQDQARCEFHLPQGDVLFGFAGSFAEWQGLDLLLEAARLLQEKHSPLKIVLMGSGSLQHWLEEEIQEHHLGNTVMLVPPGTQEQVARFLQACDAVVIPIHDPRKLRYGLSALKFWDSVSSGLPVLVPEQADLQDVLADLGIPGLFQTDAGSLADAMASVAADIDSYRRRRREIHEKVAAKYSWDSVARQVASFLQQITGLK